MAVTTEPEEVPWGSYANVEDPYDNSYNLVEEQ